MDNFEQLEVYINKRVPEFVDDNVNNLRLTMKGEDTLTIAVADQPWTTLLNRCHRRHGLTLNLKLWQGIWENEGEFKDELLAKHCYQFDKEGIILPNRISKQKRVFEVAKTKKISASKNIIVTAKRFYIYEWFRYSVF